MKDFRNTIIDCLSKGYSQNEISIILKRLNFTPNSVSSIEKEIHKLKKEYKAKTIFQLGYILGTKIKYKKQ